MLFEFATKCESNIVTCYAIPTKAINELCWKTKNNLKMWRLF